ncbi:MAG: zinc-binding alcohol dehydrogenase [Aquabacterium sp.]|nr:zinc-binding alcohol dehydrogenase [Aquabacterium sp.]
MSNLPIEAWACWLTEPGHATWRAEALAPLGATDVLVQTLHTGISRGTETLVFRGEVPASEYTRMRAPFQAGDFPAPIKYGYINVGTVMQGPSDLQGRAVFCLHPHQTHYVVPADAVHVLPVGVPPYRAILAANLETAINALWDAGPRLGDKISVIGGGAVGLLVAWLAGRIPGCDVQLVDTQASRSEVARQLGVGFALPQDARDEADLVIHASGRPEGLSTALRLAAFEATVLELSWFGEREVMVPLGGAFHARRLTLKSSQVGHIANAQRSRWDYRRRLALALSLLTDPVLDVLITAPAPFSELPAILARMAASSSDQTLCQRIDYL